MTKKEQELINNECLNTIDKYNELRESLVNALRTERLRSCNAIVIVFDDYYVLQSYNTIVAFIDRTTDTLYDVLRYVYGYTSTSAQHIAKFRHDYGRGKWGCLRELRYYPV